MIDRGQYCEYKTTQSLATGLDKYNANGGPDESPSRRGVIYPEVMSVPKVVYYLRLWGLISTMRMDDPANPHRSVG